MRSETGHTPSMDEVRNRLAIQEVLVAHSRGLDRLDLDGVRAAYWPDAEVDHGSFKGSAHEFAGEILPVLESRYRATHHEIGTSTMRLLGAHAWVETYCNAFHVHRDEPREMIYHGRYLDRMEERSGMWKILRRRVVMDWHRMVDVHEDPDDDALAMLTRGRHDAGDPSHDFFVER